MLIGWAAQNLAPSQQHITKWILGGEREWTKETPYSRIAIRVDKIHSMDQAEEALWRRRQSELLRKMWAPPFGPSRSSRPRAKWNWNVPALAYPLTPSSPFFSLPLLSAILLLFDLYEVYTHTHTRWLLPAFLPIDISVPLFLLSAHLHLPAAKRAD